MTLPNVEPVQLRHKDLKIEAYTPENRNEEERLNKKIETRRRIRCCGIGFIILGTIFQFVILFLKG